MCTCPGASRRHTQPCAVHLLPARAPAIMAGSVVRKQFPREVRMRKLTFLLFVCFLAILVLAQTPGNRLPQVPPDDSLQRPAQSAYGHAGSMWRLAEVRVVPLDVAAANRKELASLRARVELAKLEYAKLNPSDPAVREQLGRQIDLMDALLLWADRQSSDTGKSPTALEVQQHLNNIEGKVQCEACHSGIVGEVRQPRGSASGEE